MCLPPCCPLLQVSRLGVGDCFGEPSILRDEASEAYVQPASVVAITGVRCWVLRRDHFRDVLLSDSNSNNGSSNGESNQSSIDLSTSSSSGAATALFGRSSDNGSSSNSSEANLELAPTGMDRSLRGNIAPIREGVPEGEAAESMSPVAASVDENEARMDNSDPFAAAFLSTGPHEGENSTIANSGSLK